MHEYLILIGIGLVFLGIFIIILASVLSAKSKVEYGGVVFIGPFPVFGVASSKELMKLILIISAILIIFFALLAFRKF